MSKEGLHRFYAGNTEALQRVHNAYMDGISPEAQAYIDKNDLHYLAHHPDFNIRAKAESEHLQAVKELRGGESSGPGREGTDSDGFLGLQIGASKSGRAEYQSAMRREARAELRR